MTHTKGLNLSGLCDRINDLIPGQEVYLRTSLGDVDPETHKSVVVLAGTPATFTGHFREQGHLYAKFLLSTSPGQKVLTTHWRDFANIWRTTRPKSCWELVMEPQI